MELRIQSEWDAKSLIYRMAIPLESHSRNLMANNPHWNVSTYMVVMDSMELLGRHFRYHSLDNAVFRDSSMYTLNHMHYSNKYNHTNLCLHSYTTQIYQQCLSNIDWSQPHLLFRSHWICSHVQMIFNN